MIVLLSTCRGTRFRQIIAERPNIGNLFSPVGWSNPVDCPWACDNDVFANRHDPEWWCREGEARWFGMLRKVRDLQRCENRLPLFVLLPDVVGNWDATLNRACAYRHVLDRYPDGSLRRLPCAIALQNGAERDWSEALTLRPDYVFVGGTTKGKGKNKGTPEWKWRYAEEICQYYHAAGVKVHVGRASGPRRIRECLRIGADSCDGTGWIRHPDAMLPGLWRELDGTDPQRRLAL